MRESGKSTTPSRRSNREEVDQVTSHVKAAWNNNTHDLQSKAEKSHGCCWSLAHSLQQQLSCTTGQHNHQTPFWHWRKAPLSWHHGPGCVWLCVSFEAHFSAGIWYPACLPTSLHIPHASPCFLSDPSAHAHATLRRGTIRGECRGFSACWFTGCWHGTRKSIRWMVLQFSRGSLPSIFF